MTVPSPVRAMAGVTVVRLLGLAVLAVWAAAEGRSGYERLVRWDAQWYAGIARDGYGFTRIHQDGRHLSDLAFFPLYPGLERLVSAGTGLAAVDAGLLVSAVATVLAGCGIYAVGNRLYGPGVGVTVAVLWAAVPVGIVQSMAYSESLFTALAAWSLYAVLDERWVLAGAGAALAGLTRPVGVAVVVAVVVPALLALVAGGRRAVASSRYAGEPAPPVSNTSWEVQARPQTSKKPRPTHAASAIVLAPAGWLGYVAWVGWRTGKPWGYFAVARGWGNSFDGGAAFGRWVVVQVTGPHPAVGMLLCAGLLALGWLFVACLRAQQPLPVLLFTATLLLLAFTTSGYFGSKPRYLLPAFPLLLPVAVALHRLHPWLARAAVAALAAGSAVYGASWLLGPGPP